MAIVNKIIAVVALCVALFVAGAHAKAVELDNTNFESEITNGKLPYFVMFYAPWCGHCKQLKPTWDSLPSKVKDKAIIAKVDCDNKANQQICSDQGIEGFPTLKAFSTGDATSAEVYEGKRESDALVEFVNTSMGPGCDAKTLENCSDKDKSLIEDLKGLNADEIEEKIEFYKESIKHEDEKFETILKELQSQYEAAQKSASDEKKEHKAHLKILNALKKAASGTSEL